MLTGGIPVASGVTVIGPVDGWGMAPGGTTAPGEGLKTIPDTWGS